MFLEKLEIKGFKSFSDRTILEFPKSTVLARGITSIVGPNGSGKSNISDAIRWGLGEQSLKLVRCKKTEDIIFLGSEKKGRQNVAEVSLYFNNEDKKIPLDYSEVAITRRLFRDGETEYLINKNKVRLSDITILLAKANFGQKSYNVIGQGMIDYVLNITPSERKNFFYDAAGVKEYQIKREMSLSKLDRTKENLTQTEITLHELEPHLQSLTRQVKRLEQREEVEKQLKNLARQYYSYQWTSYTGKKEKLKTEYEKINQKKEQTEKILQKIQEDIEKIEKEKSQTQKFEVLKLEYNHLTANKNAILQELSELKGKLTLEYQKSGNLNIAWLKNKEEELINHLKEIEEKISSLTNQNVGEQTKAEEIIKTKEKIDGEIRQIRDKIGELQININDTLEMGEEDIKREMEIIYHAQKNLLLALENIKNLENLHEAKEELKRINTRLESLLKKMKKSNQEANSTEINRWQNELNKFFIDKEKIVSGLNLSQTKISLNSDKLKLLETEKNKITQEREKITKEINQSATNISADEMISQLTIDKNYLEEKKITAETELKKIEQEINNFNQQAEEKKQGLIKMQKDFQMEQNILTNIWTELNNLKIELTKVEIKIQDLERDISIDLGDIEQIKEISANEITAENLEETYLQIEKLKRKLSLIGGIDEEAIKEYQDVKERHDFLANQYNDLISAMDHLKKIIDELDKKIKTQFNSAFEEINLQFSHFFKILFGGGQAKLTKVMEEEKITPTETTETNNENENQNSNENSITIEKESNKKVSLYQMPENEKEKIFTGIDIYANPPGKKVKYVNALSGGEKVLVSIALVCAIIAHNPAPFIVMDEVDAALDESNTEKFANILEELSQKTQFIVITHNRVTMKKSNLIYGVTMGSRGLSNLLSIKLEDAEKIAKN